MIYSRWTYVFLLFVNTFLISPLYAQQYRVVRKMPVAGNGAWDYIVLDTESHRLFVPHGTRVEVLNPDSGEQIGVIENTSGVHGIAIVPDLKRGFVTNGKAGTVSMIDLTTYQHLAEIPAGKDPDSILFEPLTRRLFVSNGESNDITVINAEDGKRLATIPAGGAPEYATSDGTGRMWVNLEDKNAVAEIDPQAMRVVRTISVAGCSQPTSMALDKQNRRLFLGCRNNLLAVVDPDKGTIVAKLPIGAHVDGTAYDATQHLIFVSTGDGLLTILRQISADKYVLQAKLKTLRGAKTLALDETTGTLYLPTMSRVPAPSFGPPRASGPMAYLPSQFEVLVVGK